ncbi:Formate/nitrite family transporter [Basidiobolus meristosporus CBS 931.73]|uniref:Formate/nitrite family transporter n=1 Tax=Basidiobolus meristosporus CBS 931.73 TaxID=1314790 RepID=A0A1Y1YI88_9FUNG|nr:Formate/nitrite family transporter [Basidiobolus meristosporus CBS 931.73]|eukprot:ORX97426.1 Formate/nitrite family transporter [Basidiobolus meristosporus CBS 931.73]
MSLDFSLKDLSDDTTVHTEALKREFNTSAEVEQAIGNAAILKASRRWYDDLMNGFMAGMLVAFIGTFAYTAGGGLDPAFTKAYPSVQKIIFSGCFASALLFIVMFGGDLFTGNVMVMFVGVIQRKCTILSLAKNWVLVVIGNAAGALLTTYLFAYLTDQFGADPWLSWIISSAEKKVSYSFGVAFLKAVPANAFVCFAVYLGLTARDVTGKFICFWWPVFAFAICGFEHSIANMFYIPVGMMYGAKVSVGQFIVKNLIPVILGNAVGGAILVGLTSYVLNPKKK